MSQESVKEIWGCQGQIEEAKWFLQIRKGSRELSYRNYNKELQHDEDTHYYNWIKRPEEANKKF